MSSYIIQQAEKSFCVLCSKELDLLCPKNGNRDHRPWFYICWDCRKISQVGVRGIVEKEQ